MSRIPQRSGHLRALIMAFVVLLAAGPIAAQEKPAVTVDDYGPWKRVTSTALAPNGAWMAYVQDRLEGEDSLYVRALDGDQLYVAPRGAAAAFSRDSRWVAYLVSPPGEDEGRRARRASRRRDLRTRARAPPPGAGHSRRDPGSDQDRVAGRVGPWSSGIWPAVTPRPSPT